MKKTLSKILIVLAVILIFAGTPLRSMAFWGVGDITQDPLAEESDIEIQIDNVMQVVDQTQQLLKAFGLDVIIYKVSQQLSQKLIQKVLNKANGGASGTGSSLFVSNFGKYFSDIGNQQTSAFTNSLNQSSNPFAKQISVGISNNSASSSGNGLESFSLNKDVPSGTTWQNAANDISVAGPQGWDFYGQLAEPQNSPLGAAMIAQDNLAQNIDTAKSNAKTELTSSGFLPAKAQGGIGQTLQSAGQEAFSDVNTDGDVQTPSIVNQQQAGQTTQESFDRLRTADSFGKILFNTIQQLTLGLIQKGFSSLRSNGGASQKVYGSPQDVANASNGNASWSTVPQQVVDFRHDLDDGIEKTQLEIKFLGQTIDSVKKPVADGTVLSLEACLPGPDTGWQNRLTQYMTAQTAATQRRSGDTGDKGAKNSAALTQVRQDVQQAITEEESLVSNPFLNIPGAAAIQSVLGDYYKSAATFQGLVNTVITKQQVLNNLEVLRSEAQAVGTSANGGAPLMLLDAQWSKLTAVQKLALYNQLTPTIIQDFPEYLTDPGDISALIGSSTSTGTATQLAPLPAVLTSAQWSSLTDAQKEALYASLTPNMVTDLPQYVDPQDNSQLTPLPGSITDSEWQGMSLAQKTALYSTTTPAIIQYLPQYRDPADPTKIAALPPVMAASDWNALTPAAQQALYASLTPAIIQDLPQYHDPSNPSQLAPLPAVMTQAQWNAMTPAQKASLYASLTPDILQDFPQYEDTTANASSTYGDTSTVTILPLSASNPDADEMARIANEQQLQYDNAIEQRVLDEEPIANDHAMETRILAVQAVQNLSGSADAAMKERIVAEQKLQYDSTMKGRIFDEQWNEWETKVPDATKQQLYARYISLTQDISDSSTVQKAQSGANGAEGEISGLTDALSDCKAIKAHLISNPTDGPNDQTFISTLKSEGIRDAYSGPSILTASANGIDFDKLNQRIIGTIGTGFGQELQVPNLSQTATDVIRQDTSGQLFCRLMTYETLYWIPKDLTGYPIYCYPSFAPIPGTGQPAIWYHTNNGEILYDVSGQNN